MNVSDYCPEEATPGQLIGLVNKLADEVADWRGKMAQYEADVVKSKASYKLELAKAKVLNRGEGNATIVNALAETMPAVIKASDMLTLAEAQLAVANGMYDGVLAQYQALKRSIDLKVEELRTFRG